MHHRIASREVKRATTYASAFPELLNSTLSPSVKQSLEIPSDIAQFPKVKQKPRGPRVLFSSCLTRVENIEAWGSINKVQEVFKLRAYFREKVLH